MPQSPSPAGESINPEAKGRTPGGSSGGEAVLHAARCVPFGIGTDIGGGWPAGLWAVNERWAAVVTGSWAAVVTVSWAAALISELQEACASPPTAVAQLRSSHLVADSHVSVELTR